MQTQLSRQLITAKGSRLILKGSWKRQKNVLKDIRFGSNLDLQFVSNAGRLWNPIKSLSAKSNRTHHVHYTAMGLSGNRHTNRQQKLHKQSMEYPGVPGNDKELYQPLVTRLRYQYLDAVQVNQRQLQ